MALFDCTEFSHPLSLFTFLSHSLNPRKKLPFKTSSAGGVVEMNHNKLAASGCCLLETATVVKETRLAEAHTPGCTTASGSGGGCSWVAG